MKIPVFIDLRNIYHIDEMTKAGIQYYPIGKAQAKDTDLDIDVYKLAHLASLE